MNNRNQQTARAAAPAEAPAPTYLNVFTVSRGDALRSVATSLWQLRSNVAASILTLATDLGGIAEHLRC